MSHVGSNSYNLWAARRELSVLRNREDLARGVVPGVVVAPSPATADRADGIVLSYSQFLDIARQNREAASAAMPPL